MTEPLLTVPAKEVASKFGYYTDEAMLHPVGIQRHGVTRVVMLSLMEYERLRSRDRTVFRVRDLDDETLDAIRTAGCRDGEIGRVTLRNRHIVEVHVVFDVELLPERAEGAADIRSRGECRLHRASMRASIPAYLMSRGT